MDNYIYGLRGNDVDDLPSLLWRYIPLVGNPIEGMAGKDIDGMDMGNIAWALPAGKAATSWVTVTVF